MKTGTLVRFANPLNEAERNEVFVVVENRDTRILVADANWDTNWGPIVPTTVYDATDLIVCGTNKLD